MSKTAKFLISDPDKHILGLLTDKEIDSSTLSLKELKANSTDAATEKHVPEVVVEGDKVTVTVGSVEHPMLEEHYIAWIYLQTEKGGQRKALKPGEKPVAVFTLHDDKPLAVYEYCNLHGLWVKEL